MHSSRSTVAASSVLKGLLTLQRALQASIPADTSPTPAANHSPRFAEQSLLATAATTLHHLSRYPEQVFERRVRSSRPPTVWDCEALANQCRSAYVCRRGEVPSPRVSRDISRHKRSLVEPLTGRGAHRQWPREQLLAPAAPATDLAPPFARSLIPPRYPGSQRVRHGGVEAVTR